MKHMVTRAIAVGLMGAAVLAGCGGDDDDATATDAATEAAATDAATEAAATDAAPAEGGITIADFTFTAPATVKAGEAITVTNNDSAAHTFTDDADPAAFDTGSIDGGGGTATVTFAEPGEYSFHCDIHTSMTGTIVVE